MARPKTEKRAKGSGSRADRIRMRPWLEMILNSGEVPGLEWRKKEKKEFMIPWKHASGRTWDQECDTDLFRRYALHTGKFKEGMKSDPKRWKANFRCALNSLADVEELAEESHKRGERAFKIYRFTDHKKQKKPKHSRKHDQDSDLSEDEDAFGRKQGTEDNSSQDTIIQEPRASFVETPTENPVDHPGTSSCQDIEAMEEEEPVYEGPESEHNYSKNGNTSNPLPDLVTLLAHHTGGCTVVEKTPYRILNDSPSPPPTIYEDTKRLLSNSFEMDRSSEASSGESMTDEEVVDMLDSMSMMRSDSTYSDSQSDSSGGSPQHNDLDGSYNSPLWNQNLYYQEENTNTPQVVYCSVLVSSEEVPSPPTVVTELTNVAVEPSEWTLTALG